MSGQSYFFTCSGESCFPLSLILSSSIMRAIFFFSERTALPETSVEGSFALISARARALSMASRLIPCSGTAALGSFSPTKLSHHDDGNTQAEYAQSYPVSNHPFLVLLIVFLNTKTTAPACERLFSSGTNKSHDKSASRCMPSETKLQQTLLSIPLILASGSSPCLIFRIRYFRVQATHLIFLVTSEGRHVVGMSSLGHRLEVGASCRI